MTAPRSYARKTPLRTFSSRCARNNLSTPDELLLIKSEPIAAARVAIASGASTKAKEYKSVGFEVPNCQPLVQALVASKEGAHHHSTQVAAAREQTRINVR